MASTAPAKSQPLHNFDLPLKWNKDGNSSGHHHHRRRSMKSPSGRPNTSSPSPLRHSPLRDSSAPPSSLRESPDYLVKQSPNRGEFSCKSIAVREGVRQSPIRGDSVKWSPARGDSGRFLTRHESESEASGRSKGAVIEHSRNHSKNSLNSEGGTEKFEKKSKAVDGDVSRVRRSSKIKIKIPCKNTKSEEETPQEETEKLEQSHDNDETDEVQEEGKINNSVDDESKTWNLRPRKPNRKSLNMNGGGGTAKSNVSALPEKIKAQSPSRNGNNNKTGEKEGSGAGEKKEKRKLSVNVSLTKEEIEDDIFAWTGSKPARRPKKRAKNIQKQLDFVFPGLWLVSITPDSYKVSENYMKG
ncbi:hypothetical protein ACJIZ3_007815 [Penstemon smallii]|uniref:Uncharacterized protein n=1 Tax=Penstemon smallii TaxID=265156 RepID=A0ABD3T811_9LAMI